MPILRINATRQGLALHRRARPVKAALPHALVGDGPIIVMIHGYKYRPGCPVHCPHRSIFAMDPARGADAWPRHLGFGLGNADEGLAIGFGWDARSPFLHHVYERARAAGWQLAGLLSEIHARAPHRPIHLMTHSMGSEVAFEAIQHVAPGTVHRMVSLTGASFQQTALLTMESPAGRCVELINVTSRENDVFDWLFEWLVRAPKPGDRAMGQGLTARNIVTVQLDNARHLEALAALGSQIAPPRRRVCHWSGYTRPGVLRFYAHALRRPEAMPLHLMAPTPPAPRWSRILARIHRPALLPEPIKGAT